MKKHDRFNTKGMNTIVLFVERAKGIEPSCSAWEADVLPLNYARNSILDYYNTGWLKMQAVFCLATVAL